MTDEERAVWFKRLDRTIWNLINAVELTPEEALHLHQRIKSRNRAQRSPENVWGVFTTMPDGTVWGHWPFASREEAETKTSEWRSLYPWVFFWIRQTKIDGEWQRWAY